MGSLRVESWAEEGTTILSRVQVRSEYQGAPGLAHDGFVTAVLDECLGQANRQVRGGAVTARLEVDVHRPVPVGAELWVIAEVDAVAGRRIWSRASAHLHAVDGRRVASARGLFLTV